MYLYIKSKQVAGRKCMHTLSPNKGETIKCIYTFSSNKLQGGNVWEYLIIKYFEERKLW